MTALIFLLGLVSVCVLSIFVVRLLAFRDMQRERELDELEARENVYPLGNVDRKEERDDGDA